MIETEVVSRGDDLISADQLRVGEMAAYEGLSGDMVLLCVADYHKCGGKILVDLTNPTNVGPQNPRLPLLLQVRRLPPGSVVKITVKA